MAKKTNCVINGKAYFRKYANIDGKRRMFYGESEKDWQKKVDAAKIEAAFGLIGSNMTLDEGMDKWVYEILASDISIRKSTYAIYEGIYRNQIKDADILKLKLKEIKTIHVQSLINNYLKNGYSYHSMQSIKKVLNMFFKFAVAEGYLLRNPCANAKLPKKPNSEDIKVFTDEEIEKIKNALEGDRDRFLFLFALGTGLRQGEILALTYNDLHGDTVKIIRQQITERIIEQGKKTEYEIKDGPLKTDASYREVPLSDTIKEEFKKHCELTDGSGEEYVFLSHMGLRCQTGQIQKKWKFILIKAGVEYKSFHSLRHTYITKQVQSGLELVTVMQLAGHSKYETTLRYTHIEKEHKMKSIDVLNIDNKSDKKW